jgi:hypothetical protein
MENKAWRKITGAPDFLQTLKADPRQARRPHGASQARRPLAISVFPWHVLSGRGRPGGADDPLKPVPALF